MSYFVWTSDLDTGIEVIDSQHRQIVNYINEIHDAIDRSDESLVYSVLDRLTEYTISHFTFEENLMELAKYPLFPDHKMVHESFTARVRQYHDQVSRTGDVFTTARQVMVDLQVWLIRHIKREDANYVKYVKSYQPGLDQSDGGQDLQKKQSAARFLAGPGGSSSCS